MKTIRVRIAVAVDEHGCWYAIGKSTWDAENMLPEAIGEVHDDVRFHGVFVEADVPLPAEQVVVEGAVKQ